MNIRSSKEARKGGKKEGRKEGRKVQGKKEGRKYELKFKRIEGRKEIGIKGWKEGWINERSKGKKERNDFKSDITNDMKKIQHSTALNRIDIDVTMSWKLKY